MGMYRRALGSFRNGRISLLSRPSATVRIVSGSNLTLDTLGSVGAASAASLVANGLCHDVESRLIEFAPIGGSARDLAEYWRRLRQCVRGAVTAVANAAG